MQSYLETVEVYLVSEVQIPNTCACAHAHAFHEQTWHFRMCKSYLIFQALLLFLADFVSVTPMFYSGSAVYLPAYSDALFHSGVHEIIIKCC